MHCHQSTLSCDINVSTQTSNGPKYNYTPIHQTNTHYLYVTEDSLHKSSGLYRYDFESKQSLKILDFASFNYFPINQTSAFNAQTQEVLFYGGESKVNQHNVLCSMLYIYNITTNRMTTVDFPAVGSDSELYFNGAHEINIIGGSNNPHHICYNRTLNKIEYVKQFTNESGFVGHGTVHNRVDQEMIVLGGSYNNTYWTYNVIDRIYKQNEHKQLPYKMNYFGLVLWQNILIVFGGETENRICIDDIYFTDVTNRNEGWTKAAMPCPIKCKYQAHLIDNETIQLMCNGNKYFPVKIADVIPEIYSRFVRHNEHGKKQQIQHINAVNRKVKRSTGSTQTLKKVLQSKHMKRHLYRTNTRQLQAEQQIRNVFEWCKQLDENNKIKQASSAENKNNALEGSLSSIPSANAVLLSHEENVAVNKSKPKSQSTLPDCVTSEILSEINKFNEEYQSYEDVKDMKLFMKKCRAFRYQTPQGVRFKCPYPDCFECPKWKGSFNHMNIHTKFKKYPCDPCGKMYYNESSRRTHYRTLKCQTNHISALQQQNQGAKISLDGYRCSTCDKFYLDPTCAKYCRTGCKQIGYYKGKYCV